MRVNFTRCIVVAAVLAVGVTSGHAEQKPVTAVEAATATATIQAIDSANRLVTLKYTDGTMDTIYAGPEVKRFNELKVGDVVTFRYYESMVIAVAKPGQATDPAATGPTLTRGTGARPAGKISQQLKATVTVEAIDANGRRSPCETASGNKL
jgi:hypothetical protein